MLATQVKLLQGTSMPHDTWIRQKVAELSALDGGYVTALAYITSQLAKMERAESQAQLITDARIIRAEILQKLGNPVGCEDELNKIDVASLTPSTSQGYLLIKAKLLMQQGNITASRVALQNLKDKLGHGSSSDIHGSYLWRQAFTLGVLGEANKAKRLADEHEASTPQGGFQDANNIIYAQILPALSSTDSVSYRWRHWIDSLRRAGTYYAASNVDFSGSLNHRGKSLCQALLAEAFVLWLLGNRFDGYRVGLTAALLLKHWNLGVAAEGIGEIVAVLDDRAPGLIGVIRIVLDARDDTSVPRALSNISDHASAQAAYAEAVDVAVEIITTRLVDTYDILDKWR